MNYRAFLRVGLIFAGTLYCQSCGPALNHKSSEILQKLGASAGLSGTQCNKGVEANEAYIKELGSKQPLSTGLPRLAKRLSAICPETVFTIKPTNDVNLSEVTAILGTAVIPKDGSIDLEDWLRISAKDGLIQDIRVDIARLRK